MNKKDITVIDASPDNYVPYTPEQIKGDSKTAFKAAMEILFAHSADVFACVVDIIAEKYELDFDDMMQTIITHPKYTELSIHPVIRSLTYFNQQDVTPPAKKVLKIVRKVPAKK